MGDGSRQAPVGDAVAAAAAAFQDVIENFPLAISVADRSGVLMRWNAAAERLFGWTPEEVLGRPFLEFHVPPEDRDGVRTYFSKVAEAGSERHTVHTNLTKDGRRIRVEWFSHILRDERGEAIGVLALAQDVTAREADAERLRLMSSVVTNASESVIVSRVAEPSETAAPKITYVNPAFERLTGYSAEEVVGRSPMLLYGPKTDPRKADETRPSFREFKPFTVRITMYRKDGADFEARMSAFPISGPSGAFSHWVGVITDITRELEDQRRLEENERRFRQMVEEAGDLIYTTDASGRFNYVNPLCLRFTGFTSDELIGRHFTKLVAVEDREAIFRFYLQQYRSMAPETKHEFAIETKHGERRHVEQTVRLVMRGGHPVGFHAILRDITERKLAELELERYRTHLEELVDQRAAELRAALRRLRTLIKNIPGVAFRARASSPGRMLFVSEGAAELTGYRTDELVEEGSGPKRYADLIHPEDRYATIAAISGAIGRDSDYSVEYRIATSTGAILWVQEVGRPVMTESGERAVEGVILNITERKRAEEEKRKLEGQLLQAQKMEAVGQLAGGIAHDFNNLLQVVTTYTQFAMRSVDPESRTFRDLDQILKAARSATTLTKQLLAYGRRQILQRQDLALDEVVKDVMSMLRRVIGENISLELIPGYDICTVNADVGQLQQVLVNLCVNARDAMPNGGTITIKIKNVLVDPFFAAEQPGAREGEFVRLSVSDTGCGIPQEIATKIFEPFFTTKEPGKGTGMGLATVFGIVQQHDGFMLMRSQVGAGTTFDLFLPIVKGRVKSTLVPPKTGDAPGGSETILLAEDEEAVRLSVIRVLEEAGYRVLAAENGEVAVRLHEEHRERIKMLVSDLVMPRMGGREAARLIRAKEPALPVLFTSGYSLGASSFDLTMDESFHMIQKPYDADLLLRRMREILDGKAPEDTESRP
ncbi:MAG: PAS domain S-box protein [Candidatus Sumerlaeia bacterium]|nr:PAS domain S-box protein [Candidatus Sumerlaeia bacterium]